MTERLPLIDTPSPAAACREAYRERLRAYLRDPAFRAIEGFPIADDDATLVDAILALSDPPYYTACPNPFLPEILEEWRMTNGGWQMANDESAASPPSTVYRLPSTPRPREPFAADVSEGKNDPIYNAHSYHTKVPHKAIMRYILHYTEPGDVVFDGFCGTGMTGVAAQLCGDRKAVEALGYFVDDAGNIYDPGRGEAIPKASRLDQVPGDAHAPGRGEAIPKTSRLDQMPGDANAPADNNVMAGIASPLRPQPQPRSRLGARRAVLVDLSPAATFIAYNYNTPVDVTAFEREATRILREVEQECGWMYETWHPNCDDPHRVKGKIRYTVWSEVFLCPQCSGEVVFLDEALDPETQRVKEGFPCPHCGAQMSKRTLDKYRVTAYDPVLNKTVETLKRKPVLIEYQVGRNRYTKRLDAADLEVLEKIEALPFPDGIPTNAFPIDEMYHGSRLAPKGVTHVHHLFLPRAVHTLSILWTKATTVPDPRVRAAVLFMAEQTIWGMSLLNRYGPTHFSQVNRYLSGVYYISSLISEVAPGYILNGKLERLTKAFAVLGREGITNSVAIATQSAAAPALENTVDYIFTDPPFGENIFYADLNFVVESWHRVQTNSGAETIVDHPKHKTLRDYQDMMRQAFLQYYRWLKPGRWMTVEFHNSQNAVWNAIQEALLSAGFVVADVRTLDKQASSYRQVTAANAAKQDLVISAYKPNDGLEEHFRLAAGTPEGAWAFVRQHLAHLPVVVTRADGALEVLAERQPFLLFDRMVAFHIQRGAAVPLSAAAFYQGLRERFIPRDGMLFLPDQVPAYDRARLEAQSVAQLTFFVSDEKTALQWLKQQLDPALGGAPQTYQQLQPQFLKQLHQAKHESLPELAALLEQNFLPDEAGVWRAPDPAHAADLESLRRKALLREFAVYLGETRRLRQFRTEAVRAGFADAWQRKDYAVIIGVAERLPESVLQEDPELLMYYDNATLRVK